jgi:hypothetical protein
MTVDAAVVACETLDGGGWVLTEGSLFSGIMAFALAARRAGIKSLWYSEIEKFPLEVAARHFPDATPIGDVSKVDGRTIAPVDIITFGSPCQDLSMAGKRDGLDGAKSSLFFQAVRIIREMQEVTHGNYPTLAVWENVPGAFSSNKGRDFAAVLSALVGAEVDVPERGGGQAQVLLLDRKDKLRGAYSMQGTGECPNVAVASSLSQILEANAPEKYSLSPKACQGILRRAKKRGKALPQALQMALEQVASVG